MSFPFDVQEMENGSFRDASDVGDRKTKKAVQVENSSSNPVVVTTNVTWDEIVTTFPSANQDLFTYKKNSIVVMTALVTYANASKKLILNVTKTVV